MEHASISSCFEQQKLPIWPIILSNILRVVIQKSSGFFINRIFQYSKQAELSRWCRVDNYIWEHTDHHRLNKTRQEPSPSISVCKTASTHGRSTLHGMDDINISQANQQRLRWSRTPNWNSKQEAASWSTQIMIRSWNRSKDKQPVAFSRYTGSPHYKPHVFLRSSAACRHCLSFLQSTENGMRIK